jgi:hypothetical protein
MLSASIGGYMVVACPIFCTRWIVSEARLMGPGIFEPDKMLVFGKMKGLDFPYQLES